MYNPHLRMSSISKAPISTAVIVKLNIQS